MNTEIQTQTTDESEKHLNLLVRFFTAPVEVRTYTNLFYLALAFPLGLFYFIFLLTGAGPGLRPDHHLDRPAHPGRGARGELGHGCPRTTARHPAARRRGTPDDGAGHRPASGLLEAGAGVSGQSRDLEGPWASSSSSSRWGS